jgi:hypothetical protein
MEAYKILTEIKLEVVTNFDEETQEINSEKVSLKEGDVVYLNKINDSEVEILRGISFVDSEFWKNVKRCKNA